MSCHLWNWLLKVPRVQFTCLWRNCTQLKDCMEEAVIVSIKSVVKGYYSDLLDLDRKHIEEIPRVAF